MCTPCNLLAYPPGVCVPQVENRWSILYNYITITINYIKKLIITFVCNYARVSTAKTKELKTVTNAEVDG